MPTVCTVNADPPLRGPVIVSVTLNVEMPWKYPGFGIDRRGNDSGSPWSGGSSRGKVL